MGGMPGHTRRQYDQQHQVEKGNVAYQLYWEKTRDQAPRNQLQRPSKVMFADQEYSDRGESPNAMELLTQQMHQLHAAIDIMQRAQSAPAPGVNPNFRGAFMVQSCNYEPWLPADPMQGGFAFYGSYSSDGSSAIDAGCQPIQAVYATRCHSAQLSTVGICGHGTSSPTVSSASATAQTVNCHCSPARAYEEGCS
jgi:hypothetical protein